VLRVFLNDAAEIPATHAGAEFVAGLRNAFRWARFPGWADRPNPPDRELAWLRGKLLPL